MPKLLRGLRKFLVVTVVIFIATGLIVFNKLNGDQYVTLVSWVTGLYFGANTGQAVGVKIAERAEKTNEHQAG